MAAAVGAGKLLPRSQLYRPLSLHLYDHLCLCRTHQHRHYRPPRSTTVIPISLHDTVIPTPIPLPPPPATPEPPKPKPLHATARRRLDQRNTPSAYLARLRQKRADERSALLRDLGVNMMEITDIDLGKDVGTSPPGEPPPEGVIITAADVAAAKDSEPKPRKTKHVKTLPKGAAHKPQPGEAKITFVHMNAEDIFLPPEDITDEETAHWQKVYRYWGGLYGGKGGPVTIFDPGVGSRGGELAFNEDTWDYEPVSDEMRLQGVREGAPPGNIPRAKRRRKKGGKGKH